MIRRIAVAAGGMVLFALCAHQGGVWVVAAAGGLLMTAGAIANEGQRSRVEGQRFDRSLGDLLGLGSFSTTILVFMVAGAGIGAGAGAWHRYALDLPLLPAADIQPFVIVACLIGAAEELLYRGWLLGQARRFGWPAAVTIAALAHAAYKTALFAWPAAPAPVDLWPMLWLTTVGGLVLGALRVWSGSLVPAIAAHAAFDFVVYGAVAGAPWWVWG